MEFFFMNQREELIQKCAWRLVRSAEDRFGAGRGQEKLLWTVERIKHEFPKLGDKAEDYIRAAYWHFKMESSQLERRVV